MKWKIYIDNPTLKALAMCRKRGVYNLNDGCGCGDRSYYGNLNGWSYNRPICRVSKCDNSFQIFTDGDGFSVTEWEW